MSVQQFCLRWNNHQPNFISVFSTLLHNETLVDVTLAAEGRQLQAHKVVLSACSSYFQTLFTTNPCQHPIVILKDVQYIHLKTMVDFMYYGEVNVSQEQLPHILKTAEMLKIKGLAEMPDATSLTKSESKSSSSDHIEQITGGTVGNESIWGSTESQQFHHQQQRRTPSPASLSPSTRRKRLRKSSTGSGTLSTERTSEEQSSIDGGSNLNIGQMDPMTTFVPSSGNITSNINNTRILKETSSTETEHPHQESSQESVEESMHHSSSAVMKTDDDMGNVSHTMPLDIAGSTSNTGQQQQQQQQQPAVSCSQPQPDKHPMGSKRGRFLIRQPRIKKDSDLLEHHHSSPDIDESHHSHGSFHHHLLSGGYSSVLTVPPKIERHSSEPGPQLSSLSSLCSTSGTIGASSFISGASPHLLSVPPPSYLVKQHSHPLLPSQSHSPPTTTLSLQRQLSHPITQTASLLSPSVSLHTQLSADSIITSGLHSSLSHYGGITAIKTEDMMGSGSSGLSSKTASPTVVVVTDPLSNITSETTIPSIRIKTEELQRSISSPLTITRELSIENARSSHCPVVRPGPALGCNFCWNTIDAHGRILRRKTKYHCPECQTNLCIVPCFQEFHERQANDNNISSGSGGGGGGGTINNSGNSSSNTGSLNTSGTNNDSKITLRHYPKTGSL